MTTTGCGLCCLSLTCSSESAMKISLLAQGQGRANTELARNLDDHDSALMQIKVRRGGPCPRSKLKHCGTVMKHGHQTLARILTDTTLQYGILSCFFSIYLRLVWNANNWVQSGSASYGCGSRTTLYMSKARGLLTATTSASRYYTIQYVYAANGDRVEM